MPENSGKTTWTIEPFTCVHCGCLCDDLRLEIEGGRIVEAVSACAIGREALVGVEMTPPAGPSALIHGKPAKTVAALSQAARTLRQARAPVIVGLDRSTNETVAAAVALGDRIGAVVEVGGSLAAARVSAFQRSGRVSATLGEIKNRADVVVFWGVDPITTHPRHWERYSVDPIGRFVPEGRAGRKVVVVDEKPSATSAKADSFLAVEPARELEVLSVLRALVRGVELDKERVEAATGCGLEALVELVEVLKGARYGGWFMGSRGGRGAAELVEARHQAVSALVRALNERARFVSIGMGEPGNARGAEEVLAWQTGLTPSVDFGAGYPEALPGATSAAHRLARGEADAAVVVGEVALDQWMASQVPYVFIGPPGHALAASAAVAFSAGTVGLDEDGSVTRVDGVSLPVRAVRSRRFPTERELLGVLLTMLERSARRDKAVSP